MKPPTIIQRPILIIPFSGACTFGDQGTQNEQANGTATPAPQNHHTYDSGRAASLAQWILYATQTPKRVKHLMMHPYAQASLDAFRKGGLSKVPQHPLMFDLDRSSPVSLNGKPLNLTGLELTELYPLLDQRELHAESILRISYKPEADLYRVQLFPKCTQHPAKGDPQVAAAWADTNLSDNTTVATLITDHSKRILHGARELIIMGKSTVDHPKVVTVHQSEIDGTKQIDFWVVPEDCPEPKGSSVALQVGHARERLNVGDLIDKFIATSTRARRDGKIPAAAFDLDGTLFNARLYVWELFQRWIAGYQPRTDEAAKILEPIRTDVAERVERNEAIMAWNTKKLITKHYGITDEDIIEDIHTHFKEHFYNPKRSLDVPPIPGMIALANTLIWLGFRTVFPTHRSVEDDQLDDGRSATIEALRPLGVWQDGKSKLLRHEGPKIDWEVTTVGEEPKSAMVIPLLRNNPWLWAGTFADNDTTHIGSYRFLEGGIFVHVEGDRPLGKETDPIPDNVHSIRDTDAFAEEIERWTENEKPRLEKSLRAQGTHLAEKFVHVAQRITFWLNNDLTPNDHSILDLHTEDSAKVLYEVLSYPQHNPLYVSFMSELSGTLRDNEALREALPNILEIINTHNRYTGDPSTFSADIRADTLINIHRKVCGDPFDIIDEPARSVDAPTSKILVTERAFGDHANTPNLFAMPSADRYNALLNEQFERMNGTLTYLTGAYAAMTGTPAEQIRVTEYEPRLSISALMAFTRNGVNTGWHSSNKRFRIHTQRQLDRLPESVRRKIFFRPDEKDLADMPPSSIAQRADVRSSGSAIGAFRRDHVLGDDIAIWNLPRPNLTITQMGARVVGGGLVVTQSPTDYRTAKGTHVNATGFTNIMSVEMSAGDYVLPSAFLPTPSLAAPLLFQIWQRTDEQ